jgi:hypothetical protein
LRPVFKLQFFPLRLLRNIELQIEQNKFSIFQTAGRPRTSPVATARSIITIRVM